MRTMIFDHVIELSGDETALVGMLYDDPTPGFQPGDELHIL